ncbi:MAG: hypothetical protein NT178_10295 [Proteobacteria bacterium]|nr:hypothetical protein [Pseudomonadota bacterium]
MIKTAYIDYHALTALSLMPSSEAGKRFQDSQAMRSLWKEFRDDKINFVTSKKDMEMDIILYLNRHGCCITDTLRAEDAIEEFERSGIANKNSIKQYKRTLLFYEQIEALPQVFDRDSLFDFFRDDVLCYGNKKVIADDEIQSVHDILQDCSSELHLWYSDDRWKNLKYIDYKLNLDILASVLKRHNLDAGFEGDRGEVNRNLFGLVNRVIGLCKKSYWRLPVDINHADFIIKTVLQKYNYCQGERNTMHICCCTRSGVSLFLTSDYDLIRRFDEKKHILQNHPEFSSINLLMLNPPDMEIQIRT